MRQKITVTAIQMTEKKVIAGIGGIFWALSFLLSLGTFPPLEIERLEAVIVCMASLAPLLLCGTPLPDRAVRASRPAFFITLFWLLAAVSCAWSVAPPISLIYLGIFSVFPATVLALLVADRDSAKGFMCCAAAGDGLVVTGLAVWTLAQVFFLPGLLVNGQARNPFENPNALAALFGLAALCGTGLFLRERAYLRRAVLWTALFLVLSAFLSLSSKAASLILAAGFILLLAAPGRIVLRQWKSALPLFVCVLFMQAAIAALPGRASLLSATKTMVEQDAPSLYNRFDIWRATLELVAAHPFLGTGYRTFFLTYPSVRLPGEIYSGGYMAHSDPLQFWAEMGILAPLLFYATGILILLSFLKFRRAENKAGNKDDVLALSLFLGCAGFVAHAHVDFPFYSMPLVMLFGLALGALLNTVAAEGDVRPFSFMLGWPRAVPPLAVAAPVLALMVLFVPLVRGEYQTVLANRMLKTGALDAFGARVNAANRFGWGMNDRPYLLAAAVPLGILQEGRAALSREDRIKLFHQTDRLLSRAERRNSRLPGVWQERGQMLLALGSGIAPANYPDAETCFKKALAIDPLYLTARLSLAALYEGRGEIARAFDILMTGINWPYPTDDALPYYARAEKLARVLHRTGALPVIAKARALQTERLGAANKRRMAMDGAGLSTGK